MTIDHVAMHAKDLEKTGDFFLKYPYCKRAVHISATAHSIL